ncbi:tat pathway signal sequence [Xylariaceae sp. FL1651]|nr:tat pathway signal sequence [Xylariaceae sp. FL1651]
MVRHRLQASRLGLSCGMICISRLSSCLHCVSDFLVSPTDRAEYSPRGVPSEYHSVVFSRAFARESTPYQGWPDDEKDKLWRDLYWDGIAIHINEESQERLINKSQRVPIEGYEQDFLTGLGVFHQIHCLNMIRMQLYPGRYNVSLRNANGTINYIQWLHIDHCVEALRQVLVCQADTTAVPFVWSDASKLMAAGMGTTHMCRDFEKVREWAFARSLTWDNERAHVESGEIVDYSDWPLDPADTYFLNPPQGWEEAEESRLQDL